MDFQALIGKALADDAFAQALIANPEQTLKNAGVEPTPEMLDALKGVDVASMRKLAQAFGDNKAASL